MFSSTQKTLESCSWPGLAWPGLAWPGLAWPGLAWPGLAWPGLAWPGLAWPGLAWPGLAWPGLAWPGLACPSRTKASGQSLNKLQKKELNSWNKIYTNVSESFYTIVQFKHATSSQSFMHDQIVASHTFLVGTWMSTVKPVYKL